MPPAKAPPPSAERVASAKLPANARPPDHDKSFCPRRLPLLWGPPAATAGRALGATVVLGERANGCGCTAAYSAVSVSSETSSSKLETAEAYCKSSARSSAPPSAAAAAAAAVEVPLLAVRPFEPIAGGNCCVDAPWLWLPLC